MNLRLWSPLAPMALALAALVFGLDQTHKWWMLYVLDIDSRQPLGTLRVALSHFMLGAVGVGKVSGLIHQSTRLSNFSGNVPTWTQNIHSNPCSASLTR